MSERPDIFLFWDLMNDELELMGEDGEFYLYGQDDVARVEHTPLKPEHITNEDREET